MKNKCLLIITCISMLSVLLFACGTQKQEATAPVNPVVTEAPATITPAPSPVPLVPEPVLDEPAESAPSVPSPVLTPTPPVPTLVPETTLAPTPVPGPPVVITKNPTSESLSIGGKTWFIAHADNAFSLTWELIDPNGFVHSVQDAMAQNSGLNLEVLEGDTIAVSNVPLSLNGWSVQARFTGQGGSVTTSPAYIYVEDFLGAYEPVLQTYRDYINGVPSSAEIMTEYGDTPLTYYTFPYEQYGVSLLMRYESNVGYYLKDLNKDGIPELLIGIVSYTNENSYPNSAVLYDLFTLADGTPKRLLASSERVLYWLRTDNLIYLQGSGGASYSSYAVYQFNGTDFGLVDDVVMDNGSFYRRQSHYTGEEVTAGTPISEAEFWQLQEQFADSIYQFAVTPIR